MEINFTGRHNRPEVGGSGSTRSGSGATASDGVEFAAQGALDFRQAGTVTGEMCAGYLLDLNYSIYI
eukprot:356349-Chlamydomonas_euryale.AAC.4